MKLLAAALFCAFMSAALSAKASLPEPALQLAKAWAVSGKGEMRWFGFKLYDAELWVSGTSFNADSVFALQLTYARDISRERLVDASIDEMERLGEVDATRLAMWRAQLMRVFPSVKEGERIVGVNMPGRGALFYHEGILTGEVSDQQFARAFFGIWLDPRTRAPDVRMQLLGTNK